MSYFSSKNIYIKVGLYICTGVLLNCATEPVLPRMRRVKTQHQFPHLKTLALLKPLFIA